jgi:hypothetical protein
MPSRFAISRHPKHFIDRSFMIVHRQFTVNDLNHLKTSELVIIFVLSMHDNNDPIL